MTLLTSTRIAAALAAIVFTSTAAFAQTAPAKTQAARDKSASEYKLGAANDQIEAAGGTPLKKRVKKAPKPRAAKPAASPAAPVGGDSGGVPAKP